MSNEVVLGNQIAALIVALHRRGVLPASAVLHELREAIRVQPEHRDVLQIADQRVQMLVDALGPFGLPDPHTTAPPRSG